jgi:hypothetical protein
MTRFRRATHPTRCTTPSGASRHFAGKEGSNEKAGQFRHLQKGWERRDHFSTETAILATSARMAMGWGETQKGPQLLAALP